ncbi:hypothetical protein [Nocardioides insulae]|uniref:hypothetical protein n=1 Tax=Nocardioides insulae TaxID=394734 RepID=UPI00041A93D8|nr:hypothetical protein [Nocardioides insulae]
MSESPPGRVRITGPPRRPTQVSRRTDIDHDTPLGEMYVGSLLRAQLGLAARVLLVMLVGLGSLPLVFHLFPGLAGIRMLGIPVPWWLLGVAAYPFLYLLGRHYVRRAEQHESSFAELVSSRDPGGRPAHDPPEEP